MGEGMPGDLGEGKAITLLVLAVLGRYLLAPLPSVEPIIPFTVIAAMLYGANTGAVVGFLGYLLSNIVLSVSGAWFGFAILYQSVGGALAGYVAGAMNKAGGLDSAKAINLTIVGTHIFEVVVNIGFGTAPLIPYMIDSLPFTVVHIVTNVLIVMFAAPFFKPKGTGESAEAGELAEKSA